MTNSSPRKDLPCFFKNGKPSINLWAIELPWRTVTTSRLGNMYNHPRLEAFYRDFPGVSSDFTQLDPTKVHGCVQLFLCTPSAMKQGKHTKFVSKSFGTPISGS